MALFQQSVLKKHIETLKQCGDFSEMGKVSSIFFKCYDSTKYP